MKRYIGTKVVMAKPMTRAQYNAYREWVLPANENGSDEGYLVEYQDGGGPNHPAHAGYISWSPKAQFEGAYRERPAAEGLQPWQQRVVDEAAELRERSDKLYAWINSEAFDDLGENQQFLLTSQFDAMVAYGRILKLRIEAFSAA